MKIVFYSIKNTTETVNRLTKILQAKYPPFSVFLLIFLKNIYDNYDTQE